MTPSWLTRSLLLTTALILPGAAFAQDTGPTLPPPVTGDTAAPADDLSPEDPVFDDADEQIDDPAVSIGGEIIVTGRVRRDQTRSSDQVLSVLSAEDIARTGEGDIAGALSRVTGLSVVGGGFVYVRGLGDRYSLALLNGLPLPSPEPLKRVVPLDIFPTNVISSSLVQKSYSANYPGEFGGGAINLTTIAVPEESFLNVGVSGSYNSETTFENGLAYYGSATDWTGFDNSARDVPPSLNAFLASGQRLSLDDIDVAPIIGELVQPNFAIVQKLGETPANFGGSITGGTAFDIGDARMGVVATASYSNDWRTRRITQQQFASEDLSTLDSDGTSVVTDNNIQVNGLLGLGLELGPHRFRATQLFIRDTLKQTRLGQALDTTSNFDRFTQDTAWFERQLIDSQFVSELRFGDFGVDFRLGYANSQREAPFETSFLYTRNNIPGDPFENVLINPLDNGAQGAASVAFSDLNEDLWYSGFDLSYLFTDRFGVSAGFAFTDTERQSARREFAILAPSYPQAYRGVFALRPDLLITEPLISGGLGTALGEPAENYAFDLVETTEGSPAFAAGLEILGSYAKINWEPIDFVTIDAGVRYERAIQTVRTLRVFQNPVLEFDNRLENDYFLPAGTITWAPSSDFQLRANASKTIARPQFRELLPILYFDPESNRNFRGNPLLVDSEIFNAEVRAEYFMDPGERITVAGFYKKIDKPIETAFFFGPNGPPVGQFANAPEADLYGAEAEIVKYFNLYDWGGIFADRRFFTIANYTYTKSQLNVGPDDVVVRFQRADAPASNVFVDGAPLTGQSDHVANLQVGFENTERLSQQTILVKYASQRVVGRGTAVVPDIVEDPGIQVDFVWREGFPVLGVGTEWSLEVRNIFGEDFEEFQQSGDNRLETGTYDLGTSVSLGVSAKF